MVRLDIQTDWTRLHLDLRTGQRTRLPRELSPRTYCIRELCISVYAFRFDTVFPWDPLGSISVADCRFRPRFRLSRDSSRSRSRHRSCYRITLSSRRSSPATAAVWQYIAVIEASTLTRVPVAGHNLALKLLNMVKSRYQTNRTRHCGPSEG